MRFDERKFQKFVKPYILRCRDGDWNHALRVVKWVKKLGDKRKDLPLLIVAAHVHDVGWRDVLPPGRISFKRLREFEEKANENSKPYAQLLGEWGYSDKEITKVNRLISAADAHKSSSDDEAIIVDADSLSKLSIDHLKEKFKKSELMKMYSLWEETFAHRIKTPKGKKLYPPLLENLRKAIEG